MKQAMKTTRRVTMGLFTLCTMGLSHSTYAGVKTGEPIELKFVGRVESNPVFQLNLNNTGPESYVISIKDGKSNVLYKEKVNATEANFSRRYQLDMASMDLQSADFAISVDVTSTKTHKTQVYKISSKTTVKEDIVVAKL